MQKQKHVLRTALLGMMMFAMIGQMANAQDEDIDNVLFQRLKNQGKLNTILSDLNLQGKTIKGIKFMGEAEELTWNFTDIEVLDGEKPILVQELDAVNCTEYEDSANIAVTVGKSFSHTVHVEGGVDIMIGVDVKQTVSGGFLGIIKAGSEVTGKFAITGKFSAGQSSTTTETLQWNQGRSITVPPRRKARADFIAFEQIINANFTARVRCIGATEALFSDPNRRAVLYEGWHRGGDKQPVDAGDSFRFIDVGGDGVSSVYVDKNVAVECYKGKDFKTLMGIIDRDRFLVKDKDGWVNLGPGAQGEDPDFHFDESVRTIKNGDIKSVRVIDKTLPHACIYSAINYGGLPICYTAGEEANLTDYKGKVYSIELFNAKITLYDDLDSQTKDYFKEYTDSVQNVGTTYAKAFQSVKVESALDATESGSRFNIQDYLDAEDRTFTISGRYTGVTTARGKFQTKPSIDLSYADCDCAQLAGDSSDCDLAGWCAEFPGDSACRPFDVMVKADIQLFEDQIVALQAQMKSYEAKMSLGQTLNKTMQSEYDALKKDLNELRALQKQFLTQIASQKATLLSKNSEPCVTNGEPQCEVSFNPIGYTLHELKAASEISVGSVGSCTFTGWKTQRGRELWGKAQPRPGDKVLAVYECIQN